MTRGLTGFTFDTRYWILDIRQDPWIFIKKSELN